MTALINMPRAAWRRQPVGMVAVRPEYTAQSQFVFCPSVSIRSDIRNRNSGGLAGAASFSASSDGYVLDCTGFTGVWRTNSNADFSIAASGAKSFLIRCNVRYPATAYDYILSYIWGIAVKHVSSANNFTIYNGSAILNSGFSFTNYNQWITLLVIHSGSDIHIFIDGQKKAQISVGSPSALSAGTITVNNIYSTYNNGPSAQFSLAAITGADWLPYVGTLSENPWQLFQPAPSRFYLIPSSGGGPTTHDVALTLAYSAVFQPAANAQFNAGLTLATLAGAMSGPSAQFNSALSLDTNVSITLQRALTALATVQMNMTAGQSVSALNAAVAAITESIACSYTSSVTANLLAGLSLAISQGLLSSAGATLNEALTLALNTALTPSAQANYATQLSLLTTLQAALTAAISTSATLTLPASFTVTIDGEKFGNNDLALALNVQTGISTTATAILSAQLTLATQLLATPAGVGSFHSALTLANQLSTLFTTGSEISSSLSLAVSLALADAAAISLGGSLELGAVLSQVHSALAAFQAGLTLSTTLTTPMTGGLAMEGGISLAWTLGTNFDGSFFEITVTLPTGRLVVIQASERMISIQSSERLIQLLPTNPFVQV